MVDPQGLTRSARGYGGPLTVARRPIVGRTGCPDVPGCPEPRLNPVYFSLYTILQCTILYVYGVKSGGRKRTEYCVTVSQ